MNNVQKKEIIKQMLQVVNQILKYESATEAKLKRLDAVSEAPTKTT
jgi:hypothetical protein